MELPGLHPRVSHSVYTSKHWLTLFTFSLLLASFTMYMYSTCTHRHTVVSEIIATMMFIIDIIILDDSSDSASDGSTSNVSHHNVAITCG